MYAGLEYFSAVVLDKDYLVHVLRSTLILEYMNTGVFSFHPPPIITPHSFFVFLVPYSIQYVYTAEIVGRGLHMYNVNQPLIVG